MSETKKKLAVDVEHLQPICDFIMKNTLSGFDAILLSDWLLSTFIKVNIDIMPSYDEPNISDNE